MHHRGSMKSCEATETQRNKLTVSNESVFSLLRHCEERLCSDPTVDKVSGLSNINERRGNLPSLLDVTEVFRISSKNSSLRTQREEIAEEPLAGGSISLSLRSAKHNGMIRPANGFFSRMQRHQLSSFSLQHIRRLAMTNGVGKARFL
jgi:hypothetical protein